MAALGSSEPRPSLLGTLTFSPESAHARKKPAPGSEPRHNLCFLLPASSSLLPCHLPIQLVGSLSLSFLKIYFIKHYFEVKE